MEMRERSSFRDTFFRVKREPQTRPISVATEFVDTDWDEDDILSDPEEPIDNSPRASLNSVCPSALVIETTLYGMNPK
jgi:hypothetical protein